MRLSLLFAALALVGYEVCKYTNVFGARIPRDSFWWSIPGMVIVTMVPWAIGAILESLPRKVSDTVGYDSRSRGNRDAIEYGKQRHIALTILLLLMFAVYAWQGYDFIKHLDEFRKALTMTGAPSWVVPVILTWYALDVFCLLGIFALKKWGFWGICISRLAGLGLCMLAETSLVPALRGLIGIALLFCALQLGGERRGWAQMD